MNRSNPDAFDIGGKCNALHVQAVPTDRRLDNLEIKLWRSGQVGHQILKKRTTWTSNSVHKNMRKILCTGHNSLWLEGKKSTLPQENTLNKKITKCTSTGIK